MDKRKTTIFIEPWEFLWLKDERKKRGMYFSALLFLFMSALYGSKEAERLKAFYMDKLSVK